MQRLHGRETDHPVSCIEDGKAGIDVEPVYSALRARQRSRLWPAWTELDEQQCRPWIEAVTEACAAGASVGALVQAVRTLHASRTKWGAAIWWLRMDAARELMAAA